MGLHTVSRESSLEFPWAKNRKLKISDNRFSFSGCQGFQVYLLSCCCLITFYSRFLFSIFSLTLNCELLCCDPSLHHLTLLSSSPQYTCCSRLIAGDLSKRAFKTISQFTLIRWIVPIIVNYFVNAFGNHYYQRQ